MTLHQCIHPEGLQLFIRFLSVAWLPLPVKRSCSKAALTRSGLTDNLLETLAKELSKAGPDQENRGSFSTSEQGERKIQGNWPRVFSNSSSSSLHLTQYTANPSVGRSRRAEESRNKVTLVQRGWQSSKCFLLGFFYSHVFVVCSTCHIPSHWFSNDQDTIPHRLQCRRDAQSEHRNDCRPQLTVQWATKLIKICVSNHVLQTSGTLSMICSISTSCLVSL